MAPNVDLNVYRITIEVIPAANATYTMHFATSCHAKFARMWGPKIGTMAGKAMG